MTGYSEALRLISHFDLVADVEITGTPILNRRFAPSAAGDNALVAVSGTDRLKLYKATLSPSADIAGEVVLKLGSTALAGIQNPKSGGQYVLVAALPDYEYGALGDDLIVNLPSAIAVTVNVSYEIYSP